MKDAEPNLSETHARAEAKDREAKKFANALGIREGGCFKLCFFSFLAANPFGQQCIEERLLPLCSWNPCKYPESLDFCRPY